MYFNILAKKNILFNTVFPICFKHIIVFVRIILFVYHHNFYHCTIIYLITSLKIQTKSIFLQYRKKLIFWMNDYISSESAYFPLVGGFHSPLAAMYVSKSYFYSQLVRSAHSWVYILASLQEGLRWAYLNCYSGSFHTDKDG